MYVGSDGKKHYTLKEKYNYYKSKAENANGKNKQGGKVGFTGRVALANKANNIKRKMGRNKRLYDSVCGGLTINVKQ